MDSDIDTDTKVMDINPGDTMWFESKVEAEEMTRRFEQYMETSSKGIAVSIRPGFINVPNYRSGRKTISIKGYRLWFTLAEQDYQ